MFLILFGNTSVTHVIQVFWHRSWFFIVFFRGCVGELLENIKNQKKTQKSPDHRPLETKDILMGTNYAHSGNRRLLRPAMGPQLHPALRPLPHATLPPHRRRAPNLRRSLHDPTTLRPDPKHQRIHPAPHPHGCQKSTSSSTSPVWPCRSWGL